jgi:hypothetical protein
MVGAVDLTDLDMWVRGVPYDEFARLRRQAPVAWFPDEGSGFWSVTRLLTAGGDQVAIFGRRPGMGGYAVTKAGPTMLPQSLAVDHAHQGLRVEVRGYEGS